MADIKDGKSVLTSENPFLDMNRRHHDSSQPSKHVWWGFFRFFVMSGILFIAQMYFLRIVFDVLHTPSLTSLIFWACKVPNIPSASI